jgi:hypothetical protein
VNAQLKPVAAPVERPTYDNHFLGYETDWIKANRTALHSWWDGSGDDLPDADFDVFCRTQHDIQLSLRDAYRDTHSAWRDK